MRQQLKFKKFRRIDFDEYNSWFKDHRIKNELDYIDEEWLDFILKDKTGVEYSIFMDEILVSVVGIIFPTEKHSSYGIKNIALNPEYFRKGIGTDVLKELYKMHPLKANEFWLAFVAETNTSGQCFFEKNGWSKIKNGEAGENMLRYEKRF